MNKNSAFYVPVGVLSYDLVGNCLVIDLKIDLINQECGSGMHCPGSVCGFLSDVKGTVLKETVKLPARMPTRTSSLDPLGTLNDHSG